MVVGNVPEAVDLVVAGGGPGGYTAALEAAHRGRRVLLIDAAGDDGVGGVCLHVGCIPSKTLIETAELHHRISHAQPMGIACGPPVFDMATFQGWKAERVAGLCGGVRGLLKQAGVTVKRGRMRITQPGTVVVSDGDGGAQFLNYKDLILATGSAPSTLADLPIDGERIVDSTGALSLTTLPESVAVVGGGYIGLELGTALAKLGSRVTILEADARLLPAMDASLHRPLARRLGELGVDVVTGAYVTGADDEHLLFQRDGKSQQVRCELIVVAVGRRANTAELGLEELGLKPGGGGLVPVAPDRAAAAHVYAIGDITDGPALAHKATAEAVVAAEAACGGHVAFEPQVVPVVVFSDPEIASVGWSAAAAAEAGADVRKTVLPLSASGRAATMGQKLGSVECISDVADGTLLGVTFVGPHASELVAEAALAIEMGASVEDLSMTIHPHPTLSEQLYEVSHAALRAG
ncbi:MAG: dihydrolipoyl dehydrogenase [Pseudomonadota bacterium]